MKNLLNKLFFGINPTYIKVILFAIITAVITAVMLVCPLTADTSFANIGALYECWILFALMIICNCEKPLEAGIKTFIFFLISQPLIYLLQVPFYYDGFGIFKYYPMWFILTLFTFPGAMLAWYIKKDNIFSGFILSFATSLLMLECVYFIKITISAFPKYLLSAIFCLLLTVTLIFTLLKNKVPRIIASLITVVATVVFYFLVKI